MEDDPEVLRAFGLSDDPEPVVTQKNLPQIPDSEDIKELAKNMTPHVIRELFAMVFDDDVSANIRVQAGKEILDRGHGKSASESPAVAVQVNVSNMSPEDLGRKLVFLDRLRANNIDADDNDVIDIIDDEDTDE